MASLNINQHISLQDIYRELPLTVCLSDTSSSAPDLNMLIYYAVIILVLITFATACAGLDV